MERHRPLLLASGTAATTLSTESYDSDNSVQPFQIWSAMKWLTIPATCLLVRHAAASIPFSQKTDELTAMRLLLIEFHILRVPGRRRGD